MGNAEKAKVDEASFVARFALHSAVWPFCSAWKSQSPSVLPLAFGGLANCDIRVLLQGDAGSLITN